MKYLKSAATPFFVLNPMSPSSELLNDVHQVLLVLLGRILDQSVYEEAVRFAVYVLNHRLERVKASRFWDVCVVNEAGCKVL